MSSQGRETQLVKCAVQFAGTGIHAHSTRVIQFLFSEPSCKDSDS